MSTLKEKPLKAQQSANVIKQFLETNDTFLYLFLTAYGSMAIYLFIQGF